MGVYNAYMVNSCGEWYEIKNREYMNSYYRIVSQSWRIPNVQKLLIRFYGGHIKSIIKCRNRWITH